MSSSTDRWRCDAKAEGAVAAFVATERDAASADCTGAHASAARATRNSVCRSAARCDADAAETNAEADADGEADAEADVDTVAVDAVPLRRASTVCTVSRNAVSAAFGT